MGEDVYRASSLTETDREKLRRFRLNPDPAIVSKYRKGRKKNVADNLVGIQHNTADCQHLLDVVLVQDGDIQQTHQGDD